MEFRNHVTPEQDLLSHLFARYYDMASDMSTTWTLDLPMCSREHVMTLCLEGKINVVEYPTDKMHRWLGFVQGVLIAQQFTTVDAERDFTRPLFHSLQDDTPKSFSTEP